MGVSGGPYDVAVGQETEVDPKTGAVAIELINESNYAIQVRFGGGVEWLAAWTGDLFHLAQVGGTGVTLTPFAISDAANPPSAVVLSTSYFPGDKITGTFPYPLNRQTNLGNGSIAANVNQVINDTNTAPSIVVEARPSGAGAAQLQLNNDGSGLYGGGNTTVDNAGNETSSGNYQVNSLKTTGTQSAFAGNYGLVISGPVNFEGNNVRTNGSGRVIAGTFQPSVSSVAFAKLGYFGGTSSGTFSHGAGTTPSWIGITDSQAGSSMTVGVASYTATQCTVTAGAAHTWLGIAL